MSRALTGSGWLPSRRVSEKYVCPIKSSSSSDDETPAPSPKKFDTSSSSGDEANVPQPKKIESSSSSEDENAPPPKVVILWSCILVRDVHEKKHLSPISVTLEGMEMLWSL